MDYEQCYQVIIKKIKNSIQTKNDSLHDKLIFHFKKWFHKNYKDKLEQCCKTNDFILLEQIYSTVDRVCNLSDYEKLKVIYEDTQFMEFKKISQEIYNLATNMYLKKTVKFDNHSYEEYLKKVSLFSGLISDVFQEDYKLELSECILDLEYLKNHGNVRYFSLRLNNFMN